MSQLEIDGGAALWTQAVHIQVNAWRTWETDITDAHLDAAFEEGASFDWASYGFPVTSTIYTLAERSRVLWGGTAGGITGGHEWILRETPRGVHVETNESFAGSRSKRTRLGCNRCSTGRWSHGSATSRPPPSQRPGRAKPAPGWYCEVPGSTGVTTLGRAPRRSGVAAVVEVVSDARVSRGCGIPTVLSCSRIATWEGGRSVATPVSSLRTGRTATAPRPFA